MSEQNDQGNNQPGAAGRLAVRVAGVIKHFGQGHAQIRALRGVDLTIAANQLLMLVGPSGCGKTTLLSIICGLLAADRGEIEVFGVNWKSLSTKQQTQRRGQLIGYVFQQFNLIPTLTALENVTVPLLIRGVDRREAAERAAEALEQVGLGTRGASRPTVLSGGEQQRVAIARALVGKPRLLVADEPTANLDSHTGQKIIELIRSFAERGDGQGEDRCVIVVTHDARVFPYADRIEQMEDGRVVGSLDPQHYQTWQAPPVGRPNHGPTPGNPGTPGHPGTPGEAGEAAKKDAQGASES
jgi:putative ABC transport system ATP-binding protein